MTYPTLASGLPDPATQGEFYDDIVVKRFFAWVIDNVLVLLMSMLVVVLTAFVGLFFWVAIYATIDFLYRWRTLSSGSATLGMRLASVEMRTRSGARFDAATAFFHTVGYAVSMGTMFIVQAVSVVTILMTPRRQSLTDMVMGTAALNRHSLY